ncbi:hypothetical protein SRHO_G00005920 [Serrasalmus rhombeus]
MLSEMDDRDDIKSSISTVLPDLPESILNIVEETLQSLGVGTIDDFQFVQEADLLCVLRPIQARKLVASWKQTCSEMFGDFIAVVFKSCLNSCLLCYTVNTNNDYTPFEK